MPQHSADATERYAPTQRFSNRVADYERWRPGYPAALTQWLIERCGLSAGDAVADIGCGTGLFARDLLAARLRVYGIEPNAAMRAAAERNFAGNSDFLSVDGRAEVTGLAPHSVRLVSAAQAFHWFDVPRARAECVRILQPGGRVALIWNVRRVDTPFLRAYEDMLRRLAPDYGQAGVPEQASIPQIDAFFASQSYQQQDFEYLQHFDAEGLRGRLLSSSYVPAPDAPGHAAIVAACDALFTEHAQNGIVEFPYDTKVFLGQL
ncbi:MAG: methyltransferase [Nevskia sp.]|nr:methyltransferase [Nevskia sp.]